MFSRIFWTGYLSSFVSVNSQQRVMFHVKHCSYAKYPIGRIWLLIQ